MGILGKIVEFAASDTISNAIDVPIKALDKTSKNLKKNIENSERLLFECKAGEKVLLLNQQKFTWRERFYVYDGYQNVKYSVVGEFTSIKCHFHIYDAMGNDIAYVKEKLVSTRPSAIIEAHPHDFVLNIRGKKVGNLRSKWAIGKSKFSMDNGWIIEGNITGWSYTISKDGRIVATVKKKLLYWGDTYLVTYPETENELLILMVVLSLDISAAPTKIEDFKDTLHKKTHYWL